MNIDKSFYNKLIKLLYTSQTYDAKYGKVGLFIKSNKLKDLAKEYHLEEEDDEQMINNINLYLEPFGYKIISNNNDESCYGDYKIVMYKTMNKENNTNKW